MRNTCLFTEFAEQSLRKRVLQTTDDGWQRHTPNSPGTKVEEISNILKLPDIYHYHCPNPSSYTKMRHLGCLYSNTSILE